MVFNNFISWKSNIKKIANTGYSIIFDSQITTLEKVKNEIIKIGKKSNNESLIYISNSNALKYTVNENYSEYYYSDEPDCNIPGNFFEIKLSENIKNEIIYLNGRINFNKEFNLEHLILEMSGIKSIIKYNTHYSAWENDSFPNHYRFKKGLKIYESKIFRVMKVDISIRPGRFTWKFDFIFQGGSDYWFGPAFFNIVPKETLQSFTDCDVNEMLENGLIHIKLFDLIDYWKDENQQRLAKFREILKIDED